MARGSVLIWILLLGPAHALAAEAQVPPAISNVREQFGGSAEAQFDLDGDGRFDANERVVESVSDPNQTSADAVVGPVEGSVEVTHAVSVSANGNSLHVTFTIDCRSERPASGDVLEDFGYASARGGRYVGFQLGSPGSFAISGSTTGSPLHDIDQDARNSAEVRFYSGTGILAQALGNHPGAQGVIPDSIDVSGALAPGIYNVYVSCETAVPRRIGTVYDAPLGQSRAQVSLTVTAGEPEECESETLTWVGGRAGEFGVAENWDPPQVPQSIEDVRCDEMLVQGGRGVVVDLGSASAAAGLGPLAALARNVHGVTIDGSRELRLVNGTLVGDNLSPVVGERSLEIQNGGSLLLEAVAVHVRHAAVGALGTGAIDVAGGGRLETTGRLGLGLDGSGSLLVRGGGLAIAAEAVLGESVAQGSVTVQGPVSRLETGNIAVGLEDDGALLVEAGGLVTSETGAIDFDLSGDARGRVEVRGADAAGNPSKWTADALDVGARGSLDVAGGARVEVAGVLSIGGGGQPANCEGGLACVWIDDGVLETGGVVVGDGGSAELRVGSEGRIAASGTFTIGTGSHDSKVRFLEGSDESVLTDLAIATASGANGSLELKSSARLDLIGRFRVGDGGGGAGSVGGTLSIDGDPADPRATRVSALDGTGADSVVGGPTPLPPNHYGAQLQIESADLVLSGFGHDLVIERNGFVNGGRALIEFDAGGKLVNKGALVGGGFVIVGDYVQEATGFLNASVFETPATPSPQGARALAASAPGARALAKAPAPPPFEPLVVTGDATLAGLAVLQFGNGVAPAQGDQFGLLQVEGEVTGAFDAVQVKGLAPGSFGFDSSLVNGALVLTSLTDAVALPAVSLTGKPLLLEGKKAAKLKLTRTGDTSAPLTVTYTVGGTAEAGVDFVALPGSIVFPARKKSVKLLVQPIADALAEGSESILIELAPNASFAPGLVSALTLELRDGKAK